MIRKIEVNVDRTGKIESTNDTFSGVCGETGATTVIFNVSNELLSAIREEIADNTLYYRFEVTDAVNRHFVLENKLVTEESSFSLLITNAFTENEGKITVLLSFESEGLTLCTLPLDLKIEKGCTGKPDNAQAHSTIVTVFKQADNLLQEIVSTAESAEQIINSQLKNASSVLNECEQRKTAAEAAALSAIEAANSAAESKTQAEEMLSAKEDVANKETNLMQDVLADHTKYASAKATQELVNAVVSYFSGEMRNADARLEGLKSDRTELEETNALLAETQEQLETAKQEIERLKTAEDFELVGKIVCDGITKNYYLRDLVPLKKIYIVLNTQTPLTESVGSFSIYVNSFSGSGNALVVTEATAKAKHFRLFSERIVNGVWKTDSSKFADAVYNSTWATSYALTDVDYITAFRFTCGDGETKFLPEGTTIKVYGVKA